MRVVLRLFMLKYYNWSHIRIMSKSQFYYSYWVVVFIPIIFAFLQQISPLLEVYKEQSGFILEFRQAVDISFASSSGDKNIIQILYDIKRRFFTWEVSMQIAFFASLFLMFARIMHGMAPKIINEYSKREYKKNTMMEIDSSSDEFLFSIYREALNKIEEYEKHFEKKFDEWPNIIELTKRQEEFNTIEISSNIYYDVQSTRRIGLFVITNIFYLLGFALTGIVLFARMIVVLQGI
jgi:hypothetical protein